MRCELLCFHNDTAVHSRMDYSIHSLFSVLLRSLIQCSESVCVQSELSYTFSRAFKKQWHLFSPFSIHYPSVHFCPHAAGLHSRVENVCRSCCRSTSLIYTVILHKWKQLLLFLLAENKCTKVPCGHPGTNSPTLRPSYLQQSITALI